VARVCLEVGEHRRVVEEGVVGADVPGLSDVRACLEVRCAVGLRVHDARDHDLHPAAQEHTGVDVPLALVMEEHLRDAVSIEVVDSRSGKGVAGPHPVRVIGIAVARKVPDAVLVDVECTAEAVPDVKVGVKAGRRVVLEVVGEHLHRVNVGLPIRIRGEVGHCDAVDCIP